MWSHYCKSHKGIVLEFDIDDNSTDYSLQEVIYTKKPQNRKLEDFKDSSFPTESLYTKSDIWSYEEEVRMLQMRPKNLSPKKLFKYSFDPNFLKSIKFGIMTDECLKKRIVNYCKISCSHVTFYQMKISDSEYALKEHSV